MPGSSPAFRRSLFPFVLILAFCASGAGLLAVNAASPAPAAPQTSLPSPADANLACAPCHKGIYERYRRTPMANASGPAMDGFAPADFTHGPSGIHYRIAAQAGAVWLTYERKSAAHPLDGRRRLEYFIGSGKRGRTYLFEDQGYWFEAPINWYAKKQVWDMAPAFRNARTLPLTLEVDPGCLHCHTSDTASNLPDARNHYIGAPFRTSGIACTACHGDAAAHLASAGRTPMLRLESLEVVRRDSICLNCHLEGQVGVTRAGKRPEDFRPGDNIFDYSVFFVHRGENGSGGRATSQWEALLKSQCKLKSGDRLTCTTCHDPHGDPAPEQRVAWYRAKCLECHNQPSFAERHHPDRPDCTECHISRPPSNDIAHEQVTDHWIRRYASAEQVPRATTGDLVAVGGVAASDRDLGLAYAQEALSGDQQAARRALKLLRAAQKQAAGAQRDAELDARLGFLEQVAGEPKEAEAEYHAALAADRFDAVAASDLALIDAEQHRYGEAVELWSEVLHDNPTQSAAGLNLAIVECGTGHAAAAVAALSRILEFDPDNEKAGTMAEQIRSEKLVCRAR